MCKTAQPGCNSHTVDDCCNEPVEQWSGITGAFKSISVSSYFAAMARIASTLCGRCHIVKKLKERESSTREVAAAAAATATTQHGG